MTIFKKLLAIFGLELRKIPAKHNHVLMDLVEVYDTTEPLSIKACYYNLEMEPVYIVSTKDAVLSEVKDKHVRIYSGNHMTAGM